MEEGIMGMDIPFERWQPLTIAEVVEIFRAAPFAWGIAGGYAVELFVGRSIRDHGDMDVTIFRDDQVKAQAWLSGWRLYAADPPGSLRPWQKAEALGFGIHDIWGHREGSMAWQMQLMLAEVEGADWFSRRHSLIRGRREDLIVFQRGVPCLRPEVQLMYKAKGRRPKDEQDFQACLPLLDADARRWLHESLQLLYPTGHPWLARL